LKDSVSLSTLKNLKPISRTNNHEKARRKNCSHHGRKQRHRSRHTAQQFVYEGAHVFIVGRRQVDTAVNQIGKNVAGVQGDVSNLSDLDRLYDTVKQQKGRIDILFANTGIIGSVPLGSITEAYFDNIFSANVRASM
jgi:NAD(P)-dependent dehydrogenase (short-subunit alcohol dehydrogenase family)